MAFQNNLTERLVLGDPNGSHIVLDSNLNAIQLWAGSTIVGEWRAPDNAFDVAFRLAVAGDTDARFIIRGDGAQLWGPGNAGQDIVLYRDGAGALHLQGAFNIDFGLVVGAGGTVTTDLNVLNDANIGNHLDVDSITVNSAVTLGGSSDVEYPVGRQVFFTADIQQANASSSLAFPASAAATTPTLVPGCSISLTVTKAVNRVEIDPVAWCRNTNFTAGIVFQAQLYVDGAPVLPFLPYQPIASLQRQPVGRPFTINNMSVGAHTFELYGYLSANPVVTGYSMEQSLSTIKGKLYE